MKFLVLILSFSLKHSIGVKLKKFAGFLWIRIVYLLDSLIENLVYEWFWNTFRELKMNRAFCLFVFF